MRLARRLLCIALGAVAVGVTSIAAAQTGNYKWSLSPVLGLHAPTLGDLNSKALRSPMIGTGTTCPEPCGGQASETTNAVHLVNSPEKIGPSANLGLEFQWVQSAKHVFLMGYSTWEGYTSREMQATIPIQKSMRDVDYIRRDSISYNEFYFGWKYAFLTVPSRYRVYSRVSLNEVFDIDFRDEHAFTIRGGDLDGVKRIFIGKGQTTGVLMMQLGVGGEYFVKKNMSFGVEAGYKFSERPFTFRDTSRDLNIGGGDNVDLVPPIRPIDQGQPLGYLSPDLDPNTNWVLGANDPINHPNESAFRSPVTPMRVNFDGWAMALRFTIYY